MSKKVTPFKMFVVSIPAVKAFKEHKVRAYLDTTTGDIYGSDKITARLQSKDPEVRDSLKVVEEVARQITWNLSPDLSPDMVKIRGKVTREQKETSSIMDKNTGRGMKLTFHLL